MPDTPIQKDKFLSSGKLGWRSPSNIALIKYWGKYSRQLPSNPSISFTLTNAHTETWLKYKPKEDNGLIDVVFRLDGKNKVAFASRIKRYFESLLPEMPFLSHFSFRISSHNTFPHSSGIASSASAMSALALCICELETILLDLSFSKAELMHRASYIARLGSGSASRSVYPVMVSWGKHPAYEGSSNEYSMPVPFQIDDIFEQFHDDILIVSKEEKKVSSSEGHELMNHHTFAKMRYDQARENMTQIKRALIQGDVKAFGQIVELEALSIHSLMMTSVPSYILMLPNTLAIIQKIRAFREASKVPIYFTLDAGPNVHVLYPHQAAKEAQAFIRNSLLEHCHQKTVIEDRVGRGPISLEEVI